MSIQCNWVSLLRRWIELGLRHRHWHWHLHRGHIGGERVGVNLPSLCLKLLHLFCDHLSHRYIGEQEIRHSIVEICCATAVKMVRDIPILGWQVVFLLVHLLLLYTFDCNLEATTRPTLVDFGRPASRLDSSFQTSITAPRCCHIGPFLILLMGPLSLLSLAMPTKFPDPRTRTFTGFVGGMKVDRIRFWSFGISSCARRTRLSHSNGRGGGW